MIRNNSNRDFILVVVAGITWGFKQRPQQRYLVIPKKPFERDIRDFLGRGGIIGISIFKNDINDCNSSENDKEDQDLEDSD